MGVSVALSLEDRIDLHELLARYAHAVDVGCTEEEYLAFFTKDVALRSPFTGRQDGEAAVRRFHATFAPRWGRQQVRHVITNVIVEEGAEPDTATIRAYLCYFKTQQDVPPGVAPKTELGFVGNYDCVARKTDGRWLLERRFAYADHLDRAGEDAPMPSGAKRDSA